MTSLKTYSSTILEASKPKFVDIELSMNLGERYAAKLCNFINTFFSIVDFDCADNGISKDFKGISLNGEIYINVIIDPIKNNKFSIVTADQSHEFYYDTFTEFTDCLAILSEKFTKIQHEAATIFSVNT